MPQKTGSGVAGLKPCKRYIATHNKDGKSVYAESPEQVFNAVPGFGGIARSFSVNSVPANLTDDADIKAYRAEEGATSYRRREIVNTEPGPNLVVVDLEPGAKSPMHRTVSIDYSICVQGEMDHELDGGEKVRLYPGVGLLMVSTSTKVLKLFTRTTSCSEERTTDGPTPHPLSLRGFVAVSIPCIPFDIAGEMLKEVHIPSAKWDKLKSKM